jgi:hypothetical protein
MRGFSSAWPAAQGLPERVPHDDELPLPDYDHLPTGSLAGRIRSLDADQLGQLLDYERAHGNRLHVLTVLEERLSRVQEGAPLSEGSPVAVAPEADPGPPGGSPVSPATEGPPMNPPSHGDPTNPVQPR